MLGDKHEENKLSCTGMATAAEFKTQFWPLQMSAVNEIINRLHDVRFRLRGNVLERSKHSFELFVSSQALSYEGSNPQEA